MLVNDKIILLKNQWNFTFVCGLLNFGEVIGFKL